MGATRGTRRGNGAGAGPGWGGPAKGAGVPFGPKNAGRPPGIVNGEGRIAQARAALAEAAPLAVQTVIEIAKNVSDQRALAAALAVMNRVGLHEKSETTIHSTGYVIAAPEEAENAEAWAKKYQPR